MLKPDPTTPLQTVSYTCWFRVLLPRGDVEGGNSEACLICIQLTIIHCCSNFCYIVTFTALLNYWLIFNPCCKTRRKMLVLDRPSIFPLILLFSILQSTIQPPLFI